MADDEEAQVPLEETQPEEKTPTSARMKAQKAKAEEVIEEIIPDPFVGQGAHYVYGGVHVPAVILEVFEEKLVRLNVVGGGFSASPVSYDSGGAEGTWHYSE